MYSRFALNFMVRSSSIPKYLYASCGSIISGGPHPAVSSPVFPQSCMRESCVFRLFDFWAGLGRGVRL